MKAHLTVYRTVHTWFVNTIRLIVAAACLITWALPALVNAFPQNLPDPAAFDIEDLGSLPGNEAIAVGINDAGQVVGYSMNLFQSYRYAQGFRFTPGIGTQYIPFGPIPNSHYGAITYGNGINDAGTIVGDIDISGGGGCYEAFIAPNTITIFPKDQTVSLSGFPCSQGLSINNWNEFVGDIYNFQTTRHAFLFANGRAKDLHSPSLGSNSYARGINDSTEVVGFYVPQGSTAQRWTGIRAFLSRQGSVLRDLNPLATGLVTSTDTYELRKASATNNHHQIVGFAGKNQNEIRAFMLKRTTINPLTYSFTDLGTLPNGGGISYALGLNNAAVTVGAAYLDASGIGNIVATLFTHGRVINLNDLLSLNDRMFHWYLAEATGINDNGEIAGWGIHDGQTRAFKLTPKASITVDGTVFPPNQNTRAVLGINGTGFSKNGIVKVEVHRSDIGGTLVNWGSATANASGVFAWGSSVPCGVDLAISAWDQTKGNYSNAGLINISCYGS